MDARFKSILLFFALSFLAQPCQAFDWGDFHKVSVVLGTILGFGLGFFAIVLVMYMGCMRPFFNGFKEEVAETHRTWHPWPIGSVRWQLQQLVRSSRSGTGTQFPTSSNTGQKMPTAAQYLNVPSLQDTFVQLAPYGYIQGVDQVPIIRSTEAYSSLEKPHTSTYMYQERIDRPTYFTPSPEKPLFEEYTITREESFLSRGKQDDDNRGYTAAPPSRPAQFDEATIVRTTTTRHSQRSLKPPGSTFI